MKEIRPTNHQKTSVSLPDVSYRRIGAARLIFARHGIHYSEQEIYRRLFKFFLKSWRGHGRKTNGLRRYNADGKSYSIHPLYINQVLYAALWERALHSGESISRMLDVAIRVYLPRLLESLLGQEGAQVRGSRYWKRRYQNRTNQYSDFFINYECQTEANDGIWLAYSQKTQIIYKTSLSLMEIWQMMHRAA